MTSLRLKLHKSFQKLLSLSKRRIAEEDDADDHTKQQRTIAAAGSGEPQAFPASPPPPYYIIPPPTAPQTPSPSSASVPENMSNYQLYGGDGLPGTATNPIDLTVAQDGAGSGPAHFADPWHSYAHSISNAANPPAGWAITNGPQDHIAYENSLFPAFDLRALEESDYDNELAEYRKRLQSARCVRCKAPIKVDAATLIQNTVKMMKQSGYLHPCFRCSKCRGWSCVGGDTYSRDNVPLLARVESGKNFKVAWCCDDGRRFIIFSLLCGFEPASVPVSPAKHKPKARSKSEPSLGATPSMQPTSSTNRQTWQSLLSKGTGYGPAMLPSKSTCTATRRNDDANESEAHFQALSFVLPCVTKAATTVFDSGRQIAVAAMILRSPMLEHASELLRYATIEEIHTRCGHLNAVLGFLETVTGHFDTAKSIIRERTLFPRTEQLLQIVLGGARIRNSAEARQETAQSLFTVIEQLAVSCRKFVEASQRVESENVNAADGGTSLATMNRICALVDLLKASGARISTEMGGAAQSQTDPIALASSAWHRANCLREVPDHDILEGFYFARDAAEAEKSKPAPGRMRKLLAQVTSLSTDLPEGIFVRHGEGRPDLLKVLIVGPAGTPYEHGLFEFDMFCCNDFPTSPPKLRFRTTGGGIAAFNPNLYVNGKICLSLLGTWDGQPWEPERSTILQILVSVQSMIFNDTPFYNEPGYEVRADNGRSEAYNRNIEALTVQYALSYWLHDRLANPRKSKPNPGSSPRLSSGSSSIPVPPAPGPPPMSLDPTNFEFMLPMAPIYKRGPRRDKDDVVWGEVIRKHFELRSGPIMQTVREWEQKAISQHTASIMLGAVNVLEKKIKQLEFQT